MNRTQTLQLLTEHKPVLAQLIPIKQPLKRLAEFRRQQPAWSESSAAILRELRDAAK